MSSTPATATGFGKLLVGTATGLASTSCPGQHCQPHHAALLPVMLPKRWSLLPAFHPLPLQPPGADGCTFPVHQSSAPAPTLIGATVASTRDLHSLAALRGQHAGRLLKVEWIEGT